MTVSPLNFRKLMSRFVTGVAVVAIRNGDEVAAMTINSVTAVSLEPLLLLICIRNESRMLDQLTRNGAFSVNILTSEQSQISRHYGGQPEVECQAEWISSPELELPFLAGANASFACEVQSTSLAGDHTVIFGAVREMAAEKNASSALIYAGGQYSDIALTA